MFTPFGAEGDSPCGARFLPGNEYLGAGEDEFSAACDRFPTTPGARGMHSRGVLGVCVVVRVDGAGHDALHPWKFEVFQGASPTSTSKDRAGPVCSTGLLPGTGHEEEVGGMS